MKCRDCGFKETIEGVNTVKCLLTNEERMPLSECNCDRIRGQRENETRLRAERENMITKLTSLKEKVTKPFPDIMYVYNGLHQIRAEVDSAKLEELIQYLEAYL